jgi:hypothetical protein
MMMRRYPISAMMVLASLTASGSTTAQEITTPADAFQAGRTLGLIGIGSATATINSGKGALVVPQYGGHPAESSVYAGGRNPISGAGITKQTACQNSVASSAYAQQECDAVNFLSRNPTTRTRFTIDAHTDPLMTGSRNLIRAPGPVPGTSSQQCRVEYIHHPASAVSETCTASYWVDSTACEKILIVNASVTETDRCQEGSLMPVYFSGWGGGVGYWIDVLCQNEANTSLSLQYWWWNGNNSTKNAGGMQSFPILSSGTKPDPVAFNAGNALPRQGANGIDLHELPTFLDCDTDSCNFSQYQCSVVATGLRYESESKTYNYQDNDIPKTISEAEATAPNRYLIAVTDDHGDNGPSMTLVDCSHPNLASCTASRDGAYCNRRFPRPGHRRIEQVSESWDNQCAALEARTR